MWLNWNWDKVWNRIWKFSLEFENVSAVICPMSFDSCRKWILITFGCFLPLPLVYSFPSSGFIYSSNALKFNFACLCRPTSLVFYEFFINCFISDAFNCYLLSYKNTFNLFFHRNQESTLEIILKKLRIKYLTYGLKIARRSQ